MSDSLHIRVSELEAAVRAVDAAARAVEGCGLLDLLQGGGEIEPGGEDFDHYRVLKEVLEKP